MKSIMKMLYDGELYPAEKLVPKNPDYRKFYRELSELRESLNAHLSEDAKKSLERMNDLYQDIESMTDEESFIYGMKLGMLLMMEVLRENNDLTENE